MHVSDEYRCHLSPDVLEHRHGVMALAMRRGAVAGESDAGA
jgi:hypothetical protein